MPDTSRLLDWSGKNGAPLARVRRYGSGRCIDCGDPTILVNPDGEPQHKVCAELHDQADEAAAQRYYQGAM